MSSGDVDLKAETKGMHGQPVCLVTGGTGIVGYGIITALLAHNQQVQDPTRAVHICALVRPSSMEKAHKLLPPQVELVPGDVTDVPSLDAATAGCESVFHAAGLPEHWTKDETVFEKVNVEGTKNVLHAMEKNKVPRLVFTSTMDTFHFENGQPFDESRMVEDVSLLPSAYQKSKLVSTNLVLRAAEEKKFEVASIHPSAVFGPGPLTTPTLNDFIIRILKRQIPMLLVGGYPVIYSEDVGLMHVLAAHALRERRVPSGSRFLCSGEFKQLREVAEEAHRHEPKAKVPPVMPLWIAKLVSTVGSFVSRFTGGAPLIPPSALAGLLHQGRPVTTKAERELGWKATPFPIAMKQTVDFLIQKEQRVI